MQVIQIGGLAQAGKSVLGALIASHIYTIGYIPVIIPFAKALKDQATALGFKKETHPEEYRKYCQEEGAKQRSLNQDHWITLSMQEICKYAKKEAIAFSSGKKRNYVIIQDDLRYMNEIALGMSLDSLRIFISTGSRQVPHTDATWRTHESETLSTTLNQQVLDSIGLPSVTYCTANHTRNIEPTISELFDLIILNDKTKDHLNTKVEKHIEEWLLLTPQIDEGLCIALEGKQID